MQWVYEQAVDRYKQKRWFMGGTRVFHPVPCGHCGGSGRDPFEPTDKGASAIGFGSSSGWG